MEKIMVCNNLTPCKTSKSKVVEAKSKKRYFDICFEKKECGYRRECELKDLQNS